MVKAFLAGSMSGTCSTLLFQAFLAGSMSGTCSTLLFQPLDVVKTRLQSSATRSSMCGEATAVMTGEGLRGLWRGVLPSLYRTVPGVGLYFSSMHWMRYSVFQGKPNAGQSLLIGAAARTFAGSVMIPFTVVKTRIESGAFQYRSVFTALESILRSEGLRGLTRGLGPTLARDVPFSSLYLAFYDLLKEKMVRQTKLASTSPEVAHMAAGLGAGLLASLVTQPADMVKTQMQLGKERKISSAVASIYREEGLGGFAKGLAPRMLRRSVMAALAWTLYEKITTSLTHMGKTNPRKPINFSIWRRDCVTS